jgi:hypothetical protein
MLKLILTGAWVAIVALGSVYASIELSKPVDPAAEAAKQKAVQELVRGEMVTFPVISGGSVVGYFLTKTSYVVDKNKMAEVTLPIPALITDELYTALVGDQLVRVKDNRGFDVKAFRERVKTALNKRLGTDAVVDVVIEQIDYLTKDDLQGARDKPTTVTNTGEKIVSEAPPTDIKEASPSESH